MSWDIYGNPLRRGYCEVHPNVHEEYPCSLCEAEIRADENKKHSQQQQQQYYQDIETLHQLHSLRLAVLDHLFNWFSSPADEQQWSVANDLALSAGIEFKNGQWILKEGE